MRKNPKTETSNDQALERAAHFFKALAHPARLAILKKLAAENTCNNGQLVEELPLARTTVFQHLKVLKEAGLIQGTVEGPHTCYCLNRASFREAKAAMAPYLELDEQAGGENYHC